MTDSIANDSTARGPLRGVRVLDLGEMVSAPYCAKMLGDLGADVIKVESPGGDEARRDGPFPEGRPEDPEASALFLYLNTNKRSIVCDPHQDRDLLQDLFRWADVAIDNRAPQAGEAAASGPLWEAARAVNPHVLFTSITPYGLVGPKATVPADELTIMHGGGLANLLPVRSRSTETPPVKLGGYQAAYQAGVMAAFTTLSMLFRRSRTAPACLIDISIQDVLAALVSPYLTLWKHYGITWGRISDRPPAMGRMETADGFIILNAFDDHHFEIFRGIMGNPDWCAGDEWKSMAYRSHHLMDIAPQIDAWAKTQEKEALHRRAGEARIPNGPINDARDVLDYRQYAARDFFVDVDHGELGSLRLPGWPYHLPASPPSIRSRAPRLDAHGDEIRAEVEDLERSATTADHGPSRPGTRLPLEGIRVLEFAWVWAGPYTGLLLASLGAEVIKVESHKRQDLMRRSFVWPLEDPHPHRVPTNQGMAYNSMNLNKRAITLDLATTEGAELARKLAATADIVFDNMRPGALDKLGLGPEQLRAEHPELIVASSSGRGRGGPETEFLGYAMPHQGIGGGAYISGHPDEPPCHSLGDVDIMNAMTFAAGIVAALHHRERTGEGQFIDYSQCEGVTALLGEVLLGYQLSGEMPERMGNHHHRHAPHNLYRAWGVDRWIAIACHDDDEFLRLCTAMGRPQLAADERFLSATQRKENESELDAILAAWARERDRDWMVAELRRAGVRAAPSQEARDLWVDRHLHERGAFATVEHPEMGPLEMVDAPLRIEGIEHRTFAAPLLGEHTDEVLRELLGLSDVEIAALREREIVQ